MTGPRIYTEAWERLRVAAKDTETRQPAELRQTPDAPGNPKPHRGHRLLVVAMVVLALLAALTMSLWIDSQVRLIRAAREAGDFNTRIELLQEKMQKVEDERQRLAFENGRLAMQYEQRAEELAQLEQEMEALKFQKERSKAKPKQSVPGVETPPIRTPGAKAVQETVPPNPTQGRESNQRPQRSGEQGVKVYAID